jgi:hypothetical protein
MEIEIQGIPQSLRTAYQGRVKTAKADLARYKKLSKDTHSQLSRSELLGGRGSRTSLSYSYLVGIVVHALHLYLYNYTSLPPASYASIR